MEKQVTFVARTLQSWMPHRWDESSNQAAMQWDRSKQALVDPEGVR